MTGPRLGQVFTPPALADVLWSHALAVCAPTAGPLRIIEPAAGDGALVQAGRAALAARELRADAVAIELDAAWIPLLRGSAGDWAVVHGDALSLVDPGALPTAVGETAGAASPREIAARIPWLVQSGVADLVVANPPWVRETGHASLFRQLRTWHGGHHAPACPRNADLSHVFVAHIARWLRPGGVAALLMPAYWLDTDAGAHVRRRLSAQGHVEVIWRAGSAQWFDGASVEASIVVWTKGGRGRDTAVLDVDPRRVRERIALPAPDSAWTLRAPVVCPTDDPVAAGDHWRVVEGVSTGANRLRARDVERIPAGTIGEGILVLTDDEVDQLGLAGTPMLRRRHPASRGEWILLVRDGDLPGLDLDAASPLGLVERHLTRFRPVLEGRAEMRRNRSRSWYAVAWPRPELATAGCVVTQKWARGPAFATLPPDTVAMTDQRVLVPRTPEAAAAAPELVAWLNGPAMADWWQANARRRGAMMEFYGAMLKQVPVPRGLVRARSACSSR